MCGCHTLKACTCTHCRLLHQALNKPPPVKTGSKLQHAPLASKLLLLIFDTVNCNVQLLVRGCTAGCRSCGSRCYVT